MCIAHNFNLIVDLLSQSFLFTTVYIYKHGVSVCLHLINVEKGILVGLKMD